MTLDTHKNEYATLKELEEYLYGSAEVIGLIMAKLLKLPEESYATARMLGRAFQYINFIRDIAEDNVLGRCYFPQEYLKSYNISSLHYEDVIKHPILFKNFMKHELQRYYQWQEQGEEGFKFIPKRYRIPIQTASSMYRYTAKKILQDPFIVYRKKIKPSAPHILGSIVKNILTTG
jgi:phytoene synthase